MTDSSGLGSAYVAVRPRACIKVGCRIQCEQELHTTDRVDTGSVVSDIRIGYRPCHFLDIADIASSKN